MNVFLEKWKLIEENDKQLKSILLNAVNKTACKDTDCIASYKVSDDQKKVDVEYVVIASDSHTCVDYNEHVELLVDWFNEGFDIVSAWKNKQIADKQAEISDLQEKASALKDKAEDILAEYEEIKAHMQKLHDDLIAFENQNTK